MLTPFDTTKPRPDDYIKDVFRDIRDAKMGFAQRFALEHFITHSTDPTSAFCDGYHSFVILNPTDTPPPDNGLFCSNVGFNRNNLMMFKKHKNITTSLTKTSAVFNDTPRVALIGENNTNVVYFRYGFEDQTRRDWTFSPPLKSILDVKKTEIFVSNSGVNFSKIVNNDAIEEHPYFNLRHYHIIPIYIKEKRYLYNMPPDTDPFENTLKVQIKVPYPPEFSNAPPLGGSIMFLNRKSDGAKFIANGESLYKDTRYKGFRIPIDEYNWNFFLSSPYRFWDGSSDFAYAKRRPEIYTTGKDDWGEEFDIYMADVQTRNLEIIILEENIDV